MKTREQIEERLSVLCEIRRNRRTGNPYERQTTPTDHRIAAGIRTLSWVLNDGETYDIGKWGRNL